MQANESEMIEVRRLIEALNGDYVETAYHLRRYLRALDYMGQKDQEAELKDAVIALNVMRGDMNNLFKLLQPRVHF